MIECSGYCATGLLDAKKSDRLENDKHLIALPSIEKQIEKLLASNGGAPLDEPRLATSRHVAPDGATEPRNPDAVEQTGIQRLEHELRDARIAGEVKDRYIERIEAQNEALVESANQKSYTIGRLEAQL